MSKLEKPVKGQIESDLLSKNHIIAGVDEVGRGCIAGPVVAGCVELDYEKLFKISESDLALIRDSKTLSHNQRVKALSVIEQCCKFQSIGVASVREIEEIGILKATFLAMRRAMSADGFNANMVLVDGNQRISDLTLPQMPIVKGDSLAYCIAAASIIAKEHRDNFMKVQGEKFPVYGFENHVGYGTAGHLKALNEHGVCTLHRRNFAPVSQMVQ